MAFQVQTGAAIRLDDWAKLTNNPVTMGLIVSLYDTQSIIKDVPLKLDSNMEAKGVRIDPASLPTVTYGQLNVTPGLVRTPVSQHADTAVLMRNNVYVDVRYRRDKMKWITNPIEVQAKGVIEAWARQFNTDVVQNDPTNGGNVLAPVGWFTRMNNLSTYQAASDVAINANALPLSSSTTQAQGLEWQVQIEKLLMRLNSPDGNGVVLYMNEDSLRYFSRAMKIAGPGANLDTTKDEFDRQILTYKNARLRDIGRQNDGTDATYIITNTETTAGTAITGGTSTSIYGVRYGSDYLTGWHDGKLDLQYIGVDPTGYLDIHNIDYLLGMYYGHSRCLGRIYNIATT